MFLEFAYNLFEPFLKLSATTYESAVIVGTQATSYAVLRVIEGRGTRDEGRGSREFLLPTLDPHPSSLVPIEISLGKELAEKTNLKIGDEAGIITLENEFAPTTSKVFIKEIFQTGLYEYRQIVRVPADATSCRRHS